MSSSSPKIKVLLVDDSAVIRSMISGIIATADDIHITNKAINGQNAITLYKKERPDVVLLDIEMPLMDGIDALKHIIEFDKTAKVVMCSTLTRRNAEISLRAMSLGAADYISKPESPKELLGDHGFKGNLLRIIRGMNPRINSPTPSEENDKNFASVPQALRGKTTTRGKPLFSWRPSIVTIGSSTGGPQALFTVLKHLTNLPVPIVITQHMPATFTALLAKHITDNTDLECTEASDDLEVLPGKAYLAAGGKHMLLKKDDQGKVRLVLGDGPSENFCKPAVDPMVQSAVDIYGAKTLGVILTGMGQDGLKGCQSLIDAGGYLAAQNAETSVVWGMPGAVAQAGLCSEVLPLDELGPWIKKTVGK